MIKKFLCIISLFLIYTESYAFPHTSIMRQKFIEYCQSSLMRKRKKDIADLKNSSNWSPLPDAKRKLLHPSWQYTKSKQQQQPSDYKELEPSDYQKLAQEYQKKRQKYRDRTTRIFNYSRTLKALDEYPKNKNHSPHVIINELKITTFPWDSFLLLQRAIKQALATHNITQEDFTTRKQALATCQDPLEEAFIASENHDILNFMAIIGNNPDLIDTHEIRTKKRDADTDHKPLLMWPICHNNIPATRFLIQAGAKIQSIYNIFLNQAMKEGCIEVADFLIQADIPIYDEYNTRAEYYPVMQAIKHKKNSVECLQLLIDHKFKINASFHDKHHTYQKPCNYAIDLNNFPALECLIDNNADLRSDHYHYEDETPLHRAVKNNNIEAIQLLLRKKLFIDFIPNDNYLEHLLSLITQQKTFDCLAPFLDYHALFTAMTIHPKKNNPTQSDVVFSFILESLKKRDLLKNINKEHEGLFPLQNALLKNCGKAKIKELIQNGASLEITFNNGHTPLTQALDLPSERIDLFNQQAVELFIEEYHVDIHQVNGDNLTPLSVALNTYNKRAPWRDEQKEKYGKTIKYLLEHGALVTNQHIKLIQKMKRTKQQRLIALLEEYRQSTDKTNYTNLFLNPIFI